MQCPNKRIMTAREHGKIKTTSKDNDHDDEDIPQLEECSYDGIEGPMEGELLVARRTLSVQIKEEDNLEKQRDIFSTHDAICKVRLVMLLLIVVVVQMLLLL